MDAEVEGWTSGVWRKDRIWQVIVITTRSFQRGGVVIRFWEREWYGG